MAAVSITPAEVFPSTGASIRTGTLGVGVTVTAGVMVYLHTDGTLLKCIATSALAAAAVGMTLNGGGPGQVVRYVTSDPALKLGTTAALAAGETLYIDDATAGGLVDAWTDLDAGGAVDFVTSVGIVKAATDGVVNFQIVISGVSKA